MAIAVVKQSSQSLTMKRASFCSNASSEKSFLRAIFEYLYSVSVLRGIFVAEIPKKGSSGLGGERRRGRTTPDKRPRKKNLCG